ncbi:MAG: isopenicillin N synthase family oxygenase [Rubrivivax sp.]|nr:MAG: isopenicillin N synthase family oxygenase [Rubrivivax sp.]
MTTELLPVIDLAASFDGGAGERETARQIDAVCRESGFFYVTGHGVPQALVDGMFAASRTFFAQPDAVKARTPSSGSPMRRGWDAIGHQALDNGKPADLLEGFNIGLEFDAADPLGTSAPRRGPNQWPDEAVAPGLQATATAYMAALEGTSRHIMRLIALGLELPAGYFEPFMRWPVPSMRLLHYPPQPATAAPDQIGAGAHTDWGALTLLAQDNNGGLQVLDGHGAWHDVPPVPQSFVVNLGDLMSRWTNDAYRSTMHRVINRVSGRDRYSIPYFFDIDFHARVSALPGCFDDAHPARYPTITAGEHHQEKMRAARVTYG